jgi:predicted DNA-binding transcriptional regulator AlpA
MHDPNRLMPMPEVKAMLGGVCAATVYNLINRDGFPSPMKLGARSLWRYGEVVDWLRAQPGHRLSA